MTDLNGDTYLSAMVGIIDASGRCTLLLRRFDADLEYPSHWCFPGGRVDPGETPPAAAVREVLEETGLRVGRLEAVGRSRSLSATGRTYLINCFVTESWSGTMITFPSAEHAAAAWLPIEASVDLAPVGPATRWLATTIRSRFNLA